MAQIDRHILNRYFLGQVSQEDKEAIRQWLEENDGNRKTFMRERIRFDASLLVHEPEPAIKKHFVMQRWMRWCTQIAASIILLAGSFYLYDKYRMDQLANTYQQISVPAGNRTNLILPDGTNVWLNANSTLRYPMAFSKKSREIQLNGEAYFDVTKDKKPFIVKTDKYNVEVLGTTFNVEAYTGKTAFKTMLYNGKVKLYSAQTTDAVILSPGQTAELVGDALQVSATTDVNSYRWKDGLIYIEDKSFGEIIELFEKFYDIRIVINSQEVKGLGYRGKLRVSDGVDHALRVLQNDFPFKYERDEENNIIYIN